MSFQRGQIIQAAISDLSHDGRGVAHVDDFAVFVAGALPGEEVQFQITEVKKSYARGALKKIVSASPARTTPVCDLYPRCGGCQLQHLDYSQQLAAKEKYVSQTIKRIGKIQPPVLPIIGLENPWQYRNKALFPFARKDGTLLLGCFEMGTHNVVNLAHCPIQHQAHLAVLAKIRELVAAYGLSIYDERTGCGLLRHLLIRTGFKTGETLLGLVTTSECFPDSQKFAAELAGGIDENIVGVVRNINDRRGNVILGSESRLLWGKPVLYEEILGLRFAISATSFFQVNPAGMEKLYGKVLEAAGNFSVAVDAYCGIGSIALLLAKAGKKVYGIETVSSAISDAKENARLNGIANAVFLEGKVEEALPRLLGTGLKPDLVVLDPPRKGCEGNVLSAIVEAQISKLVYVSCNPSTLARDLAALSPFYETKWVQPVDMFPQTYHVECVVLMSRVKK